MKFSELKEKILTNKLELQDLNIKEYIPLLLKQALVNQICEDIFEYENGIAYVKPIEKSISTMINVLMKYCNLEADENTSTEEIIEVLDLLIEKDIFRKIEKEIGEDVNRFYLTLDETITNVKIKNNSIEAVISKGLDKFVNIIDKNMNVKEINKLIKTASKELQKFEPEKLKSLQEMMKVVK